MLTNIGDVELDERFTALIRKKYPYHADPKQQKRGKLTRAEDAELTAIARESVRRESLRFHERWARYEAEGADVVRTAPPCQLVLW